MHFFHDIVRITNSALGSRFISLPNEARYREIIAGVGTKSGFPQVVNAVNGSHIPIISPEDYQVLLGVFDHGYIGF